MIRLSRLAATALALSQISLMASRPALAQPTCPVPTSADFEKQTLMNGAQLNQPIEMAVAPDGKVFVAERFGNIQLYEPTGNVVSTAVKLNTYTHTGSYDVGGILGLAVSPAFPADNWVYIYYAPTSLWNGVATQTGGNLVYRLSRMRFAGGKIDTNTQQILFDIPVQWETHNGGSLRFGKNGDLYLSTGDNSCAGCNNQYSPMDERPGYKHADDQRSTANTNDLRGKVLRIHPEPNLVNGKYYTIPAGNLKEKYLSMWTAADQAKVRPEIYTMGHRNPYRIHPDPVTGRLYIGEFGPAAGAATERGPAGADQLKVTDSAAFLGYPYFLKDNKAYCHWDYAQGKCVPIKGQTEMTYLPGKPVNTSPNNTGVEILPPAKPAVLWEHDNDDPDPIAGLATCGFGGGPVYHFDWGSTSKVKFPPWFENRWIFYGIYGGWQPKLATIAAGGVVPLREAVNAPFTSANIQFTGGIHDMEFGTDGALYALDYGSGMYTNNGNDALVRITYKGCIPTGIRERVAGPLEGSSRTELVGQGAARMAVPQGAVRAEVFDLRGKLLLETGMNPSQRFLDISSHAGAGILRVRWIW